jgi:hypothetical protein
MRQAVISVASCAGPSDAQRLKPGCGAEVKSSPQECTLAISGVVLVAADSLKLMADAKAPNPTTATAAVAAAMCLMLMTTRF